MVYSNGFGEFIYIDVNKEDDNFVDIRIEVEDGNEGYNMLHTSLYVDDVRDLIQGLSSLIEGKE